MLMKRLVLLFALVSVFAVSCEDFVEKYKDLVDNEMKDEDYGESSVDGNDSVESYRIYNDYVKKMKCSPAVISEEGDEHAATVLKLMGLVSETYFDYDGYGRPVSVSHRCFGEGLNLDRIETDYGFVYEGNNIQMISKRTDYGKDGKPYYVYPEEYVNCVCPFDGSGIIEDMELSNGKTVKFYHDDAGYLNAADVYTGTDNVSYRFLYDKFGCLARIFPGPQFTERSYAHDDRVANIDMNMLLLAHGIYRYDFDASLLMILRMGGHFGYMLMDFFIESGSVGGVYYMSYPEEKAGQTVHESVYFVRYNEDWNSGNVEYIHDGGGTGLIIGMRVSVPVTLYKLEYDAVVSNELFDPEYPEAGYAVDKRENEVEEAVNSYTFVSTYEFEYAVKELVIKR